MSMKPAHESNRSGSAEPLGADTDPMRAQVSESLHLRAQVGVASNAGDNARDDASPEWWRGTNDHLVRAALEAARVTKSAVHDLGALLRTSRRDSLTDTPDRVLMRDRLDQAVSMATRRGTRFAVCFVDMDHFKQINDRLGHGAGDEVLRLVARRLESAVRDSDTVSRHGGDEFLVLLAEVSQPGDAAAVAAKMLAALAEPARVGAHALALSASLGVAVFPDDGDDAESLVARADAAMFRVKRSGGGGFEVCAGTRAGRARAPGSNGDARHAPSPAGAPATDHTALLAELNAANERLVAAVLGAREAEGRAGETLRRQAASFASRIDALRRPLEPIREAVARLEHVHGDPAELARLQGVIEGQLAQLSTRIERMHDDGADPSPGRENGARGAFAAGPSNDES